MSPIYDGLGIDILTSTDWTSVSFRRLPRHWKPPTVDTVTCLIRNCGGVAPLRHLCRVMQKPPAVVLPVLREAGLEVGPGGWAVPG